MSLYKMLVRHTQPFRDARDARDARATGILHVLRLHGLHWRTRGDPCEECESNAWASCPRQQPVDSCSIPSHCSGSPTATSWSTYGITARVFRGHVPTFVRQVVSSFSFFGRGGGRRGGWQRKGKGSGVCIYDFNRGATKRDTGCARLALFPMSRSRHCSVTRSLEVHPDCAGRPAHV